MSEPVFDVGRPPVGPTLDMNERTLGSAAMIAATARWCATIDSNEASCGPSVTAVICPLSPLGRKSLGTWVNITPVSSTVATKPASTSRGCAIACLSVRS